VADEDEDSTIQEPEELTLWRALIAARDAMLEQVRIWSAEEHPIRQMDRAASALAGFPPPSDEPDWGDGYARERAASARKEILELDRWINETTRAKGQLPGRGRTLQQLEERVRSILWRGTREKAEAAIVEWLRDRDDVGKRQHAADSAWRYYTESPDTHPVGGEEQRLERLEAAERTAREARRKDPGRKASYERRAGEILKHWGDALK